MRYPEEPHQLIGGVLVHDGAVGLLDDLLASGHTVALDDDGDVIIDPLDDLCENLRHSLEAFEEDLVILLRAGGRAVH